MARASAASGRPKIMGDKIERIWEEGIPYKKVVF